ncbi:MAG: hypothetical protein IT440_09185 [Phycisphaeraceae bacterium]|nr:hypothetical protein [Phycisphaeraceae bacterium]
MSRSIHQFGPCRRPFPAGLILLLLLAPTASAKVFYLSPDGDDQATGTHPATPWQSLQHVEGRLGEGDSLVLAPGEYLQTATLRDLAGSTQRPVTIQAAMPGFSVLRGSLSLGPWRSIPNRPRCYDTAVGQTVYNLIHTSTGQTWRRATTEAELRATAGSWWQHPDDQTLLIHLPDGLLEAPSLEAVVIPGIGLSLIQARSVVLQGITFRGFGSEPGQPGLLIQGSQDIRARDCQWINCAGGVTWNQAVDSELRRARLQGIGREGDPATPGLLVGPGTTNLLVADCELRPGTGDALRLDAAAGSVTLENLQIRGGLRGLVLDPGKAHLTARRCVITQCASPLVLPPRSDAWRIQQSTLQWTSSIDPAVTRLIDDTNLLFGQPKQADPHFCDPAHDDYRLQADSPIRNCGDAGDTPGALPYRGDVLFLKPDGHDDNDGLSVATAIRTLAQACRLARPGVTVYLMPGEYPGPLKPLASGDLDLPLVFRAWGSGRAMVSVHDASPALDLDGLRYIHVEDLDFSAPMIGAVVRRAAAIRLDNCRMIDNDASALVLLDACDVMVRHCTLWNSRGPAVIVQGETRDIQITSSLLHSKQSAALGLDMSRPPLFAQYNAYFPAKNHPLALMAGASLWDREQLRGAGFGNAIAYITMESTRQRGGEHAGPVGAWTDLSDLHGNRLEDPR